jgi:membrane protease YdiL (CAAX protease family)
VTLFQLYTDFLIAAWLLLVLTRFRRSTIVLTGGLILIGAYVALAWARGQVSLTELGLGAARPWFWTVGFAVVWLALMLAYSPVADWLATRWVAKPPTLGAFKALQQSLAKLVIGIVIAWALGGILEELIFRGIVLRSFAGLGGPYLGAPVAAALAIVVAALGAGVIHLYQGLRAAIIITQLSVLFGLLFVLSGYDLWAVMLCHGLYDTVAFIRFAMRRSKYSRADAKPL